MTEKKTNQTYEFHVSEEEIVMLTKLLSDRGLQEIVLKPQTTQSGKTIITLNVNQAEQIRAKLTEELAQTGFDESYSPNARGEMLESLIDRLYIK